MVAGVKWHRLIWSCVLVGMSAYAEFGFEDVQTLAEKLGSEPNGA
jgi:hypothetical protein